MTQGSDRPMLSAKPVPRHYSPLGTVVDHDHITAFELSERLPDGVHRITLDDGSQLELLVAGDPLRRDQSSAIPLFISGALRSVVLGRHNRGARTW